jgi:hypothetical protein
VKLVLLLSAVACHSFSKQLSYTQIFFLMAYPLIGLKDLSRNRMRRKALACHSTPKTAQTSASSSHFFPPLFQKK